MASNTAEALTDFAFERRRLALAGLKIRTAVFNDTTATIEGTANGRPFTALVDCIRHEAYICKPVE